MFRLFPSLPDTLKLKMEDLVVKLTKALMMHANDLFDLTNSQVMILIETPSGETDFLHVEIPSPQSVSLKAL